MGSIQTWIAVRGKTPAEIHAALGTRPTGAVANQSTDSRLSGFAREDGWYFVRASGWDFPQTMIEHDVCKALSQGGEVVSCIEHDGSASSDASEWVNGRQVWRRAHLDSGASEASGTLPEALAPVVDDVGDGTFELPGALARARARFDFDEDFSGEELHFDAPPEPPAAGRSRRSLKLAGACMVSAVAIMAVMGPAQAGCVPLVLFLVAFGLIVHFVMQPSDDVV